MNRHPAAESAEFSDILEKTKWHTLIGYERLLALYLAAKIVPAGDFVECGVARGGSAALLGLAAPSRRLWLFDTFAGLPKPGPRDGAEVADRGGSLRAPFNEVRAYLFGLGIQPFMVVGDFRDTLTEQNYMNVPSIALLHIDCDLYESTKCVLENLYDRVVVGGYLQCDDFGSKWIGAKAAIEEFRASRGITTPMCRIDADGFGWIKEEK